jgi:O-succinylbenzoate synthase
MMIEQPLADDDIIEHSALQRQIETPICLDESIVTYDDARHAIDMKSCGIINIKPGRVGGLYPSKRIHDFCYNSTHKIPVWIGGMSESAIGKLDNIAIATLPGFSLPGDIGPSHWYFHEDLINPSFEVQNGIIVVPKKPGLGYPIDEGRVDKYTVEKFVIE